MILRLCDFHFPDTPARLYPDNPGGPWQLEIGFGDGAFWDAHSKLERGANYLGVELSGTSLLKAQARARRAGRRDLLTRMPASVLLRAAIPSSALARIHVHFPDPWPKAGHEEHRLLREPFFVLAADRLQLGGEIWFTTDHAEYFDFALERAANTGLYHTQQTPPPEAALQTKYARKWAAYGLGAQHARFRLECRGASQPHLEVREALSEEDMPHAVVRFNPSSPEDAFEKAVYRYGETTVVLLERLFADGRGAQLFLAHIEEEDLVQEVLVRLSIRADGSALVRLERFGGPIITPGVKRAVESVTGWLEARGARVELRAY